jgi:hypothetical protein
MTGNHNFPHMPASPHPFAPGPCPHLEHPAHNEHTESQVHGTLRLQQQQERTPPYVKTQERGSESVNDSSTLLLSAHYKYGMQQAQKEPCQD